MVEDDVLTEVRAAREAYARSFGFDVRAMAADLRALDAVGDWPVIRCAPRRPGSIPAAPVSPQQPPHPSAAS